MVKVGKKDDKDKKKKKDSEAPDSLSDDDLRYSAKRKQEWNEYNMKNPQYDGTRQKEKYD